MVHDCPPLQPQFPLQSQLPTQPQMTLQPQLPTQPQESLETLEGSAGAPVAPLSRPVYAIGRILAARIAGQSGLVTRSQLRVSGWTDEAIRWQIQSGRWLRMHPGVYLTTPGRRDWEVRVIAAPLAVGPPSCLSGASAGQAWGLLPRDQPEGAKGADVEILVPAQRNGASLDGISVRRSRQFNTRVHATEWPHRTTVEHTIFDLSVGHGPDRCIALMAKGCQSRLTTESSLAQVLSARAQQPHRPLLAEALGLIGDGAESAAEVRYIREVEQAHGLPVGRRQEPAPGSRSRDTTYDEWGVIVEIDGRLGHLGWLNQQRAGARDRKAATTGRLTVRGGWTDVAVTPCDFASDVATILSSRGWSGAAQACGRAHCRLAAPEAA